MIRQIFIVACCAACLGCGDKGSPFGVPGPGAMRLVSASAVTAEEKVRQLIPNGSFTDWWAGAPAPEGFGAPDGRLSTIEKLLLPNGAAVVRQVWRAPDLDKSPAEQFTAAVPEGKAAQEYELRVEAAYMLGQSIVLNVLQEDAGGKVSPVQAPFIKLGPSTGIVKRYIKRFTSPADGKLLITASAGGPSTVEWYRWELVEKEAQP